MSTKTQNRNKYIYLALFILLGSLLLLTAAIILRPELLFFLKAWGLSNLQPWLLSVPNMLNDVVININSIISLLLNATIFNPMVQEIVIGMLIGASIGAPIGGLGGYLLAALLDKIVIPLTIYVGSAVKEWFINKMKPTKQALAKQEELRLTKKIHDEINQFVNDLEQARKELKEAEKRRKLYEKCQKLAEKNREWLEEQRERAKNGLPLLFETRVTLEVESNTEHPMENDDQIKAYEQCTDLIELKNKTSELEKQSAVLRSKFLKDTQATTRLWKLIEGHEQRHKELKQNEYMSEEEKRQRAKRLINFKLTATLLNNKLSPLFLEAGQIEARNKIYEAEYHTYNNSFNDAINNILLTVKPTTEEETELATFRCPISLDYMQAPVIGPDRQRYDLWHLNLAYYYAGYRTCPLVPSVPLPEPDTLPRDTSMQARMQTLLENLQQRERLISASTTTLFAVPSPANSAAGMNSSACQPAKR